MKKTKTLVSSIAFACLLSTGLTNVAVAAECSGTIKVLAQPRDGLTLLEDYKSEFEKLSGGASFEIDYLNENDRRAKTKADASTIGKYNVYYIDEANVALFASAGWVAPLMDYYPADYDYADFDPGRQKVATYDGKVWFAPITGGGDLMVYRKDLLEAAGIAPPKTLDEYIAAVKKLNQPDQGIYGTALRGQRGSGANVWRWMPFFKGFGGNWFDGKTPVFDGEQAVKATETYLELFKYSAPGSQTGGWDEAVGAFTSGQVAMLIESTPLVGMAIDPKSSKVAGKVGYLPPPADGRRLRPWSRDRREGQQGRGLQDMRRSVHRVGDLQGKRGAAARGQSVQRAQPHQHHDQPEIRRALRPRSRPGARRHRQGHCRQFLAEPAMA